MRRRSNIFTPPPLNAPWREHGSYLSQMTQYLLARRVGLALVKIALAGLGVFLTAGVLIACSLIASLRGV